MSDLNTVRREYYEQRNRRILSPYGSGELIQLLDHKTALNETSDVYHVDGPDNTGPNRIVIYSAGYGAATGGTILLEFSLDPNFLGQWAAVITHNLSAVSDAIVRNTSSTIRFLGGYFRARISSAITGGGSVSIYVAFSSGK